MPKRSKNNILKVDINEFEYFLVENRNNHYKTGVSIDSLRYKIYKETDEYPSFIKTIIDSIPMSTDDNGVITKFQNYDLGLPGSGLLIWHIDNRKIDQGISSYKINENINHMGVDLEESDGAQDIGFDSFFMFDDPLLGILVICGLQKTENTIELTLKMKENCPHLLLLHILILIPMMAQVAIFHLNI